MSFTSIGNLSTVYEAACFTKFVAVAVFTGLKDWFSLFFLSVANGILDVVRVYLIRSAILGRAVVVFLSNGRFFEHVLYNVLVL